MRGLVWAAVVAGGAVLADWGAGQGMALWLRGALDGSDAAGAAQVTATGFPARIGVQLDAPWGANAGMRAVALDRATITAPVWNPLAWTLDLPLPQKVELQGLPFALTGKAAALTVAAAPAPDLPLAGITLRMQAPALQLEAAEAPSLAAESVDLALRPTEDPQTYTLAGAIVGAALPPGLAAALSRQAGLTQPLPDRLEHVSLDAGVGLAQPLMLLSPAPVALSALDLRRAELVWGGHRISVSGRLTVSPEGTPEGTLTIALSDFPVWLDLGLAAGLVPRERKPMLAAMGDYLSKQSPDGSVQLPLSFANGRMTLAAIPLGPAPQLR